VNPERLEEFHISPACQLRFGSDEEIPSHAIHPPSSEPSIAPQYPKQKW
jgi:hypothetical protein